MSSIDLSDYEALYIRTAYEYLDALQAGIIVLGTTKNNQEAIDTMYRSAHSLKSQSALMGYKNTASLNEFIEHTLKSIKDGKFTFTEKVFLELKTAIQKIEKSINSIEKLHKELTLQDPPLN
ncbi:MAG TPA: Hpt domain-containing protein [Candidatus Saccharimonadales bacterium]|nr:Hpt domain-containing protein [Candidatus Saccharimonadales bacterium]